MDKEEYKSSTNLEYNIAGLLCYVLGIFSGIAFIIIEKKSKFVKFHAIQSTIAFGILFAANLILGSISILSTLISLATFVLWLFMMYKAYNGEMYKLPIIGDFSEKQLKQIK